MYNAHSHPQHKLLRLVAALVIEELHDRVCAGGRRVGQRGAAAPNPSAPETKCPKNLHT